MPPTDHRITLVTRTGCHLCEDARTELQRIAGPLGTPIDEVVVDGDRTLTAEYGELIPVVLIDGAVHGYYRIEEDRLRRALQR